MWYFTWILGVALAVFFASAMALWFENQEHENKQKQKR